MTETPNLTPEQKERNLQYLLNHLDEYFFDRNYDCFINVNNFESTIGTDYFCIYRNSLPPESYRKIEEKKVKNWRKGTKAREELTEKILQEIEN